MGIGGGLLTLWFVCGVVTGWEERWKMGRRWVSSSGLGLYRLCLYTLLLFVVGSGACIGKNKGGIIQCYFQGFHLFQDGFVLLYLLRS